MPMKLSAPLGLTVLCLLLARPLSSAPASPELAAKIDRLFAKWNHPDTPGVIVAIALGGETIFARGYGMANLEHNIPLTPDTVTESGSVAKQFTASAVVLLAQRGRLSLQDPVRKYLPELPAILADKITVRMLLNHTSGLRDIHGLFDLIGRPSYTSMHENAEVLRVMSRQRQLNFEPGAEYLYCNTAYILASIIVERVSGQPFGAFCEENVFRPHGMSHTHWREDFTAIVPGRATGYERKLSGGFRIDLPYSDVIGNGGLLFTVGDLLKWNASLDESSGEWGAVAEAIQTPSKLNDGRAIEYCLGLERAEYAGLTEIAHGGSTAGYRTYLARFPERRLSFALLSNVGEFNSASMAHALTRIVLDLPPSALPHRVPISAEALKAYTGLYHSAQTDDLISLTARDGKLFEAATGLIPTAPGKFENPATRTTFVFTGSPVASLVVTAPNGAASYLPMQAARPSPAELAVYAGTYKSEELDVADTLSVKDGRLWVERWPGQPMPAKPTFVDGFRFSPAWHATFTRDASGAITGYEMTNGRCRRVKFSRI